MKRILAVLALLSLTACASIKDNTIGLIPSFWDPNQAQSIVRVRQAAENLDCDQPQLAQAKNLSNEIQFFMLYSDSAGYRHRDMIRLVGPMQETAQEWAKRAQDKEPSKVYCELKVKIVREQAREAAKTVLGRF